MAHMLDTAADILKKYKENDMLVVTFIKKDGTRRVMTSTLNMKLIPQEQRPKQLDLTKILNKIRQGILSVYDLERQEWRSIPMDRIETIE
jgi:hypothetical protein